MVNVYDWDLVEHLRVFFIYVSELLELGCIYCDYEIEFVYSFVE